MQRILRRFSIVTSVYLSTATLCYANINLKELETEIAKVPRSFQFELNEEGFNTASELLYQNVLKNLNNIKVPDQEFSLAHIFKAEIKNININANWQSLAIEPTTQGLNVNVGVNNLKITADKVVLSNAILPFISSTCKKTQITFGNNHSTIPVSAELGVSVQNENFIIDGRNLNFELAGDQYHAEGPTKCHGLFGIRDYISQFVMNMILKHAKGIIVGEIKKQFNKIVPKLSQLVNDNAKLNIAIDLEKQWLIPETNLALNVYPAKLDITTARLLIEMGVKVKPLPTRKMDSNFFAPENRQPLVLASLGLNPDMLNKILGAMFKNGGPEMLLTADTHEILAGILRTDELSYFWPDLNTVSVDSQEMRVFISFTKAPQISLNAETNTISVAVKDFSARLQIQQQEIWRDYFTLLAAAELHAQTALNNQKLEIKLSGGPTELGGYWPSTYQPTDPTFDKVQALEIFTNLADFGFGQINPISLNVPIINAKGVQLGIDNLRIDEPFVKINLLRY